MVESFETQDRGEAERILRAAYGSRVQVKAGRQAIGLRLGTARLTPAVRLGHVTLGTAFRLAAGPPETLVICAVRSGRVCYRSGGTERAYGPGDVFVPAGPADSFTARCEAVDLTVAVIDPALPGQVAGPAPGRAGRPVRFAAGPAASPQAARQWRAAYRASSEVVLGDPARAGYPLLAASTARFLVASALSAFQNDAVTEPAPEDGRDAHPATLRRAVAFIDDNAHLDVTAADVAGAANVTVRSVQLAFQRYLSTTPSEYLRRVRLGHAHQDLRQAVPGDGITVTGTSYRWGFNSPGRFAAVYRRAYGVTPSYTLRRT